MPTNVFISFAVEDMDYLHELRALANNKNNEFDFHDWSEKYPVRNGAGKILSNQPGDPKAKDIEIELERLIKKASKHVVIVGAETNNSRWVQWEVEKFHALICRQGEKPRARIKGIRTREGNNIAIPTFLQELGIHTAMPWDMKALNQWLKENPNEDKKKRVSN